MTARRLVGAVGLAIVAAVALVALAAGEERHDPPVVRVELRGATDASEVATGFAIAPGRVVTVAHIVDPAHGLVIRDASGRRHKGRLVRKDSDDDLALISVPGLHAQKLQRAASGDRLLVRRGRGTAALDASVRRRVNATLRGPNSGPYHRPALELDARVRLGDSGAPLVDSRGRVAGVLFARRSDGRATAYAVDASALMRFISPRVSLHLRK